MRMVPVRLVQPAKVLSMSVTLAGISEGAVTSFVQPEKVRLRLVTLPGMAGAVVSEVQFWKVCDIFFTP